MLQWFNNLGTVVKLMSAFGLMATLIAVVGWQGIRGLELAEHNFQTMYRRDAIGLSLLKGSELDVLHSVASLRLAAGPVNDAERAQAAAEMMTARESFDKQFSEYRNTIVVAGVNQRAAKVHGLFEQLSAAGDQVLGLAADRQGNEVKTRMEVIDGIVRQISAETEVLQNIKLQVMADTAARALEAYTSTRNLLTGIVLASIFAAVLVGLGLSRRIARPLKQTAAVLERVALGDFTQRLQVDSEDEMGRMGKALNRAIEGMRHALHEVNDASAGVTEAAGHLAGASDQLARTAEVQAASLEESAASLVEMTATVKQNADNSRQASKLAGEARDAAVLGGKVVTDAMSAMEEINRASRQIADIVTAIDEIAFQTNLLALNAAVEAARAGEQGRGFAVVAAEVRKLAQRSATSAKEIKSLIRDSLGKVDKGSELVTLSGRTLTEIVTSTRRVSEIMNEIASASGEQSIGLEQINRSVCQMDSVTRSCSTQTGELASTAMSLSKNAHHLQTLVAHFTLGPSDSMGAGAFFDQNRVRTPREQSKPVAGRRDQA